MQLGNNERSILASFRKLDQAQQAVKALKQAGIETTQIDHVSPYAGKPNEEIRNPITSNFSGLPEMVLGSDGGATEDILLAADESASGMADGTYQEIDQNILLTVVTDAAHLHRAQQIVEQHGGQF
jgi:hypothetical protein